MNRVETTWEDEENNRRVELVVDYQLEAGQVEIHNITPQRVTFCDPQTQAPTRSIGVWTKKGRAMLAQQAHAAGHITQLHEQIDEASFVEVLHKATTGVSELTPSLQA